MSRHRARERYFMNNRPGQLPPPSEARVPLDAPASHALPTPEDAPATDIRDRIAVRGQLAHVYACDGAYNSAARVLRELAAEVTARAEEINAELAAMIDESNK